MIYERYIIDIDECGTNTHKCHKEAKCDNTVGNYTCTCNAGFNGDGKDCSGEFLTWCLYKNRIFNLTKGP